MTKKLIRSAIRSAKVTNQPWPPWPPLSFFRTGPPPLGRFGEFRPMVLRQVGDEHLLHERGALRLADQEDAVDDQRSRDVLLVELDMQLVGDRQAEQVADERAVERGEKR